MGDRSQVLFVQKHRQGLRPPFLEVGSRDSGNASSFRGILPHAAGEYVGVDASPGKGVDRVVDLTLAPEAVAAILPETFHTVFCLSVLEHCRDPWQMARNIERRLAVGGALVVSVPFAWKIHDYPADYWRFTPAGVRQLFPHVEFPEAGSVYHSSRDGEFFPAQDGPPRIGFYFREVRGRFGTLPAFWIALSRRLGLARPLFGHHYVFPPVQLDMIGWKRAAP